LWVLVIGCGAQSPSRSDAVKNAGREEATVPPVEGQEMETSESRAAQKSGPKETVHLVPMELSRKILAAEQGGVVEITELPLADLPSVPYTKTSGGPVFLISDAPEYIRVPEGAVLRERVEPGRVRLYIYNCNGLEDQTRRISTVIENVGNDTLHFRFLRYAFQGPDLDYAKVAKEALWDYFTSTPQSDRHAVPVGRRAPLDLAMESARVRPNELVHGFYDIEIDQPARISVVQTDPATPGPVASARVEKAVLLEHFGAGRGLYPFSDNTVVTPPGYVLDTAGGPQQLVVADGKIDPWIVGKDGSTGNRTRDEGNYGVIYSIRIPYSTSDGRALALLTWNPHSQGKWCGVMHNVVRVNKGKFPEGLVRLPSNRTVITADEPLAAPLIQVFPPLPGGRAGTIEITYTPPGACCLPTPLLLIPVAEN